VSNHNGPNPREPGRDRDQAAEFLRCWETGADANTLISIIRKISPEAVALVHLRFNGGPQQEDVDLPEQIDADYGAVHERIAEARWADDGGRNVDDNTSHRTRK
jgi:hypothetical protein